MTRDEILAAITAIHDDIDRQVASMLPRLGERLRCGQGCSACCLDDLSVLEVEAVRIEELTGDSLRGAEPHPPGNGCAFLAPDGSCRIYPCRPYVCRTQGLPLRWIEDSGQEFRDICELNAAGPDLVTLPEADCWLLGPTEETMAALQVQVQRDAGFTPLRRVKLRELFRRLSTGE